MQQITLEVGPYEEKIFPFVWIDGDDIEITFSAKLIGEASSLLLCGMFLGTGSKQVTFNTDITHIGKHTKSRTNIRSVFTDASSFSNDGMVRIEKGARQADGYFQSKVLLFDDAKGRSVPSLEIDENEVKAGHGSTIGRPDPNQLFYLRSRGLTELEAEKLIVSGFFDPIITLLPKDQQDATRQKLEIFFATAL